MAASACFVPAPPVHASTTTRAAAALLIACWIGSGFAIGVGLALGGSRASTIAPAPRPASAPVATTFRVEGRPTFYRPAGSRAERPVMRLQATRFEPSRSLRLAARLR